MADHSVVIAGAGPTGLMLAGELAVAGADVAVVERRVGRDLTGSRAGGMTSRTIEVLDQRGIVDRFLDQGVHARVGHYAGLYLDVSELPTRYNYALALLQYRIESILTEWIAELGVPVYRGREVVGLTQDRSGVDATVSDGTTLRSSYLVGCDGGRSIVRKSAGIAFPGWDPSTSCLVADVEMTEEPPWGMHREGRYHSFFRFDGENTVRVLVTEAQIEATATPTVTDLRAALVDLRGTDYGLRGARWVSRFTNATRQAATYRAGRVLVAGDAAHIHFPIGGQGLNTGIQDAVNLGWKLARVVRGVSGEGLLDTYEAERYPVAARVLHNTMAQTALNATGVRVDALRDTVAELLDMPEPRARIAAMMCGLDIHYDLGAAHPLLGRRVPDLDLLTADGPTRMFALLNPGRGVLVDFRDDDPRDTDHGADRAQWNGDCGQWADSVSTIRARCAPVWTLPVVGDIPAPHAVLVRPDGYVAWVKDDSDASGSGVSDSGLSAALSRWFA